MALVRRIANLFRRSQVDREIDAELESHLAMRMEDNVAAGMTPDEAGRDARLRFGNPVVIKERSVGADAALTLQNLLFDLRFALRQMRKAPGFSLTVILTLALGIGATTAIFTLVYATLLRSLPYPEADRILSIQDVRMQGESTGGLVSVPRFLDLEARAKSLESTAFFFFDDTTLVTGTELPLSVRAAGANAGFWNVFRVPPMLGRTFDASDDLPKAAKVAVLSYSAWRKLFAADPGVIGRQVRIGQESTTIVGVMPESFNVPNGIELWHPAQFSPADWVTYRGDGARFINVFARVARNTPFGAAQSDLDRIGDQLRHEFPGTDGLWRFRVERLRDHLYGALRPALTVLLTASAFLLVIACLNVANLLLTRASTRQREVALRRALGASERRIQLQFLMESSLLALLGGGGGLALTFFLVRTAATKLPGRLGAPGTVAMDWHVVVFALLLSAGSALVFGFAPALLSRRAPLNCGLKQGGLRQTDSSKSPSTFIAVQVALSLVLLVVATLLGESLWNLLKSPLGFNPDHLLTFRIVLPWNANPVPVRNFYSEVQRRIASLPGVDSVGQIGALPTEDWHRRVNFDADWAPATPHHDAVSVEGRSISGDYLRAIGTPMLAGRQLTAADDGEKIQPVLVNRAFVQQYGNGGNVLGRRLVNDGGQMVIVGVAGDVRGTSGSIAHLAGPEMYFSANGPYPDMRRSFAVRTQVPPEQLIQAIREQVHQVDPQQAIANVATMDELLGKAVAQPRLNMVLVAAFSFVALVLACVGIYGVVAWSVAQRTQEIGVRMALGSTRIQILLLFVRRAGLAAIVGGTSGTFASLLLTRFLRSQLYGVKENDPLVYLAATFILIVPVMIATLRPALAAARVNPVEALRAE